MSTADNGGLLRRLSLFSKLSLISSYTCYFLISSHNFFEIYFSCQLFMSKK